MKYRQQGRRLVLPGLLQIATLLDRREDLLGGLAHEMGIVLTNERGSFQGGPLCL